MLQGIPHAVETPGGFAAWDAGWILAAITGIWAVLTTGRLLRGEEETGRAESVLAAPVRAGRVLLLHLLVLVAATAVTGAAIAAALTLSGAAAGGSALFGLGVAGFAATFAGVCAVTAQVFGVRRRATGVATAVLGASFLVRMAANSSESRGRLRWLTPFGWLDELHAYRDPRWAALLLLLAAPVLLGAVAVGLRGMRDTGGALIADPDSRRARLGLLGGPAAFAWRGARGMLIGWLTGVTFYALMTGSVARAVTDFVAERASYREMLQRLGWDLQRVTEGYLGTMGLLFGLLVSLHACWRIGAARAEEATGRLESTLTRPVSRHRWLGGHVLLALAASLLLAVAAGSALWAGAVAGGADVEAADAFGSVLNTLPVVVLFTGLAVLVYGLRPGLTVGLSAAVAVAAYLVETIGTALDWPAGVLDLSPFHHLAAVPVEPFAPVPAAVMAGLGALAASAGVAAFERRDVVGD
jgi:ABC-2 type transport system permease protein